MSKADLSDPEIKQAFDDIKSTSSTTNWILIGYVPKSDTKLKVVQTGTGGLEEHNEQLNDGKVLFSLVSFQINNTKKFAYIAWCGEGVTGMKKGVFSSHAQDVAAFLKGFHVQINARNETDVTEQAIVEKLKKATGAAYDAGQKNQGAAKLVPTSVAQGRQQATQSNLKSKAVDKSDYNKKSESEQYWTSDKQDQETAKQPKVVSKTEDYSKSAEREQFWAQQKQQEEARAAQKPAPNVASGNASNLKGRFETGQASNASAPPPRTAPAPKKVAAAPAPTKAAPAPTKAAPAPTKAAPAPTKAAPAPAPTKAAPAPAPSKPAPPPAKVVPPPQPEPEPEPELLYEEEVLQEEIIEEEIPQAEQQEEIPVEEPAYEEPQQTYEEPQQEEYQEEPQQEEAPVEEAVQEEVEYQEEAAVESGGVIGQAKALYDYDAENPEDLSFKEGDIIDVFDKSDPSGWWEGMCDGVRGFFPSNFVEEI